MHVENSAGWGSTQGSHRWTRSHPRAPPLHIPPLTSIKLTHHSYSPPTSVDDTFLAARLLEGTRAQQRPRLWPRFQASARATAAFLHMARRHPQGAQSALERRGPVLPSSRSPAGVLVGVPGAGGEDEDASGGVGEE